MADTVTLSYPAPDALIAHCSRATGRTRSTTATPGQRDRDDVIALIDWLTERDEFATHDAWVSVGMALKIEMGDDGFDVWQRTFDETVTDDVANTKWASFASEPSQDCVTIMSWVKRANALGWRGTVRRSSAAMWKGLPVSLSPPTAAGMPMLAGEAKFAEVAAPILAAVPRVARTSAHPTMPDTGHALRNAINEAIPGIMVDASTHLEALAIIKRAHEPTFDLITQSVSIDRNSVDLRMHALTDRVHHALRTFADWQRDARGNIDSQNSDNARVFLTRIKARVRFNAWQERAELQRDGGVWQPVDDTLVARLLTESRSTEHGYRPAKDHFWDALLALSHETTVDPVLDIFADLQGKWDGTPRLSTWLSSACHTPCDLYHQAVARNVVGGIVKRARHPGAKHDTMPVFHGPQGTGKSTLARVLAWRDEFFSDEILLGDASRELVLSLAGKLVIEISEMGMRGSANATHVKAMLSRQTDRGRTAYARTVTARPRRNIFVGTTNSEKFLVDDTGNRRFLPVKIEREINLSWLRDNLAQLFGEAATLEAKGESFELPPSVWATAAAQQEAVEAKPEFTVFLEEWFADGALDIYVTAADLSSWLQYASGRTVRSDEYSPRMDKLGFTRGKKSVGGKVVAVWHRGDLRLATRFAASPRLVPRISVGETQTPVAPVMPTV